MPNAVLHQFQVLGSALSSTASMWRGTSVYKAALQPEQPLRLYDIEASAECRAVREALTALGLDVNLYPCPERYSRYRPALLRLRVKEQFPVLEDSNNDTVLCGARPIIDYLFQTYGGCAPPPVFQLGSSGPGFSLFGSVLRGSRGRRARPSRDPDQLLRLWSFESSPYSRLVRERLTELELGYTLHNLGKEQFADMGPAAMRVRPGRYRPKPGGKRERMQAQIGRVQVPYLEDPNTGVKLFESAAIIDYLEATYAL